MHIFISYAKKDTRSLALDLHTQLQALSGITAWMDESLTPAASWARQIQSEIDRSDYLIVLLSPDVNRPAPHSFVLKEVAYAQQVGKPIITIMAQKMIIPLELADIQHIDFTQNQAAGIVHLLSFIRARAGIPTLTQQPYIETKQQPTPPTRVALPSVPDFLPKPFGWCAVTEGRVTLEDDMGTHQVPDFVIAQYPITNAQFETFVTAKDGYNDTRWWDFTYESKVWRLANKIEDSEFKGDTLPRTNVCWYEAIAFCGWLSAKTNLEIILPTEQQWQRAAQGDDRRVYPWGDDFDTAKCNTSEAGISQTSSVDHYRAGKSPFGVWDMAGNVWEWCLTEYLSGSQDLRSCETRVLRGGSWNYARNNARGGSRDLNSSINRLNFIGFRVVASAPS